MTIAEVSKKFEMSADTLRYYERIGLLPAVKLKFEETLKKFDER